jgi:hypothetical protein
MNDKLKQFFAGLFAGALVGCPALLAAIYQSGALA